MQYTLQFMLLLSSFTIFAMDSDALPSGQERIDGRIYSGVYGKDYEELGKKMPLFAFYFMGRHQSEDGSMQEICFIRDNEKRKVALGRWKNNSFYSYKVDHGTWRTGDDGEKYFYDECMKIAQLHSLILELEKNPERKKKFLDFNQSHFIKPQKLQLYNFVNAFEDNDTKKEFLLQLHDKEFNELTINMSMLESYNKRHK